MTKQDVMNGIIGHNQPCRCYRCTQFHKIYDAALREAEKRNDVIIGARIEELESILFEALDSPEKSLQINVDSLQEAIQELRIINKRLREKVSSE